MSRENIATVQEIVDFLTDVASGKVEDTKIVDVGNGKQEIAKVPVKAETRLEAIKLIYKILK